MSDMILPFFLLGLAIFVLGVLLLYRGAFRSGWTWGFACLLVPPLLLLLIPLRWRRMQYGFYTLLTGLMVGGATLYAGADAPVQAWLQQPRVEAIIARTGWHGEIRLPFKVYQPQPLPNAAEAAAVRAEEKAAAQAPPPAPKPAPTPPAAPPSEFQPVALTALDHYLGKTVRVTSIAGVTVKGVLSRVNSNGVTLMTNQGTGSVSYHLAWTYLTRAEVYAPKGSIPAPTATNTTATPAPATTATPAPAATAPAPSVTLAPTVQTAPLPPAATHAPSMPIAPPAAAAGAPASAVNNTSHGPS
ncbi:hypothetical protein [Acidihalobacter ferrooxydans]|uniref:Uncharacterized protein n=1 Tax=Acidihalobacter ferrooxydans TaxID=1765967 RepID=A0A1P8UKK0_9GAMM|nr:hypothetical protein [Acidihalobacter ferrooxydans]APZ44350.1 hypothetical protein BW247_15690 [Acidihalobacter ferrooxydans]